MLQFTRILVFSTRFAIIAFRLVERFRTRQRGIPAQGLQMFLVDPYRCANRTSSAMRGYLLFQTVHSACLLCSCSLGLAFLPLRSNREPLRCATGNALDDKHICPRFLAIDTLVFDRVLSSNSWNKKGVAALADGPLDVLRYTYLSTL